MIPAAEGASVELLAGERQERESRRAIEACNNYLRLGPGRSLAILLREYTGVDQSIPPTRSLGTLKLWSQRFDWQARADSYDAEIERRRQEEQAELDRLRAERRRQVMESGLAVDFERVTRLKELAAFLEKQIYEKTEVKRADETDSSLITALQARYPNLWLADAKQIGKGEAAERVDIARFNAALPNLYLQILDDLARETGGRRVRTENLNIDYSKLTDEQLQRIRAGEDPIEVIISTASGGRA